MGGLKLAKGSILSQRHFETNTRARARPEADQDVTGTPTLRDETHLSAIIFGVVANTARKSKVGPSKMVPQLCNTQFDWSARLATSGGFAG